MKTKAALYFLVILTISGVIQCITVVGPRVLRPFGSYRVSIAGGSRAHNLYVAVEGRRANGEQFSQGREVQVQAGTSSLVGLEIGDPGPGQYSLVARSTSGPLFSSSAPLVYQQRSFCVFVQTDKRVYQPGDKISFRIIGLDKYLLPLTNTVDVSILDTGGSPVRQWAAVPLDRGVFSDEILLADEPALGEWTIQVEIRGQAYSKQILVADYVLPKFQMDIQMPKEVLFTDGRFNINVTAKHFNGLPVEGELTISAYAVFFSGVLQPVFSTPARKVVEFSGNANVVYDLKTDLDLAEDAARPLVIEAVLEEKDTLIRQNISSKILLQRAAYRLKVTAPTYFKPQLPYNVQIELVNTTGHAVEADSDVKIERLWDDGAPPNTTTLSFTNGLATYTITPDTAHADSTLNLLIKYKEVTERVVNVQRSSPSGGQFLTVELLTRNTSVGDEMRARLTATEPMDLVHYIVIGRGDILVAKTVELSPARRSVDVSVAVSARMAPGCVLLAWYPRAATAASLLAAALLAPQRTLLQHKVSVQPVSPTLSYRPNGLVEFRVSGEAGSYAALVGADAQAAAAGLADPGGLGSGLDMYTIEREVESFSGVKHSVFKNEEYIPGLGLDLGGNAAADVFENAGVVILTDGVVVTNKEDTTTAAPETGTRPPLAGPYAFSRLPQPPSPRFYLTLSPHATWMFTNLTLGNDGRGTRERWSPVNPGEWSVGAFAIHPTLGLGLASPQTFTTSVPLSITADLPETLQRGEILAIVVTLKSTLPVETSVEVTFHNSDQFFEFEPLENTVDSTKKIELFKRVRLTLAARGSSSTAFLVSAARAGEAPVIVEAAGSGVSASLFRTIDVKEGYEEETWTWALLDARRGAARGEVQLRAAAGTRLGGAALQAAGDALAPALRALPAPPAPAADANYALRPLARALVLLDYLQVTDQYDEANAIVKEAREQVATGYQRLMAFHQPDGSFSQEIGDDAEGDVWMTAVATRWLWRAARFVSVSPGAATGAARWLAAAQRAPGDWPAPAPARRSDPRGQQPLPLAAAALHALLATKGSDALYKNEINKAVDFMARSVSEELDAFTLASIAAALAAAQHPQATLALQLMDQYANVTEWKVWWTRGASMEWRNPWVGGDSVAARTGGEALRALLSARLPERAAPVARFLLDALPPADQDPDVLDALAQYAALIKTPTKLRISVNVTGFDEPRQFNVDNDNALTIQTQLVRLRSGGGGAAGGGGASARVVTEGRGVAVVGLQARGATNVTAAWPRYTLDPRVDHVSTAYRLQLSVCLGFVAQGNETESGLALLIVQLPSGYIADINTITELTSARHVVGARLQARGARVAAWVRARRVEQCATLAAPRALPAAAQRPGWATLRDLYDSSHRARVFFQPVASTACDVCRAWPSCDKACGAAAQQRASSPGASGVSGAPGASQPASAPDLATHQRLHLAAALSALVLVTVTSFLLT